MRKEVIQTAWAPNVEWDDILLAMRLLVSPWKWFGSKHVLELEDVVGKYLNQEVVAFDSGRSALYAILRSLGIEDGDEVLLQGFTCVALPNPILWVKARPVYVDIDLKNYNIDIDDLLRKITSKSKAVIIQYTFGICPDLDRIREICEKNNLFLIEDNCHNLGQEIHINGSMRKAGTIGDAAIISMGMEKIVSATRGGFATSSNEVLMMKLRGEQFQLKQPRVRDILRGLFNPLIWKVKAHWGNIGNLIYRIALKVKLHELGLSRLELVGKKADWLPYSMPNTNARLGLNQMKKIDRLNEHRKSIAKKYFEQFADTTGLVVDNDEARKFAEPMWLRFPMTVKDGEKLRKDAEKQNIYLGNWYTEVIHCKDVDMGCMLYTRGTCPKAEDLVHRIVNLPTHIGISDADAIKLGNLVNLED